jgi:class 3 adenylate cyclase
VPAGRPAPNAGACWEGCPLQQLPLHRTIVVVDVASFTDPARTMTHQLAVHEGLYDVLNTAFAESGIDLDAAVMEDRGDGAMILLPPDVPKSLLADQLPTRLIAGLKRYNAIHSDEAAVQLRVGLHAGEVRVNRMGVVSPAINFAFRILEASDAKLALRHSHGVLALIASETFYRDVILHDPAADPESYRQIPVVVKETSTAAWLRLPDGLVKAIPETPAGSKIERPTETDPLVLDLLPPSELDRLQAWLTGVTVGQLPTLVRRAVGPAAPPAPPGADAWEVFTYLADFNAGGDGFPPALSFLELLARQVGIPLRANLTEWINHQARRLRLVEALQARRDRESRIPVDSRLHLLIVVQHDGIDPDRYLLSYWRQDDPDEWPPARGDTILVSLDELEYRVDELVVDSERAWAGHGGTVALEFLLPRALLHLPVHHWHKEHESGDPRPLCLDYPIVVRSLERMRSPHWHRRWHDRWQMLVEAPSPERAYFCGPADLHEPHRLDAILNSPQWTLMVLANAPPPHPIPGSGTDELTAALRAGLPALIWHFEAPSDALREIVPWLVEGDCMSDLPGRVQAARLAAFQASPAEYDVNIARDLVVLWDDPRRMVALDQPIFDPRP